MKMKFFKFFDGLQRLLRVQEQPIPTQQLLAAQTVSSPQPTTSTSAAAAAPVCVAFKRFEFFEKGSWRRYAPAAKKDVSEQFGRGQSHAYLEIAGGAYYIDFEHRTQSKVDTGYTRSIRWEGFDGIMHEPTCPIERDIKAVIRAMDAAAAAEVSGTPHPMPAGTPEEVSQFNTRVAHARHTFASLGGMFTEVDRNTAEFAEVSLKLSTNMQQPNSQNQIQSQLAGASLICIHRIAAISKKQSEIKGDVERKIAEEGPALEAWHGAPLEAITGIVRAGFALPAPRNAHRFGQGVYLAPLDAAWMSCDEKYAVKDSCGIQHIMLCDFAQGKPEPVKQGSTQFLPSADSFDTAVSVDSMGRPTAPTRYIVWSSDMNKRILPKYVVSFSLGGK
jgi:hypothetical protein